MSGHRGTERKRERERRKEGREGKGSEQIRRSLALRDIRMRNSARPLLCTHTDRVAESVEGGGGRVGESDRRLSRRDFWCYMFVSTVYSISLNKVKDRKKKLFAARDRVEDMFIVISCLKKHVMESALRLRYLYTMFQC